MEKTGFEHNDKEHAELIRTLHQLRDLDARDADLVLATYDRLIEIAETHFRNEEALMLAVEFEPFSRHYKEHRDLLDQARIFRQQLLEDKVTNLELVEFMLDWVTRHMNREDLEFKTYYYRLQITE